MKRRNVAKYTQIGHALIKKRVLKCLESETELQRRCKFMTLRQNGGLKMRCMGALRDHAERQIKLKYCLQKLQLGQKSKVFDGFYRYMTYRKYFKEKKAQTELVS